MPAAGLTHLRSQVSRRMSPRACRHRSKELHFKAARAEREVEAEALVADVGGNAVVKELLLLAINLGNELAFGGDRAGEVDIAGVVDLDGNLRAEAGDRFAFDRTGAVVNRGGPL